MRSSGHIRGHEATIAIHRVAFPARVLRLARTGERAKCLRMTVEGTGRFADTAGVMGIFAAVTLVARVQGILVTVTFVGGLPALWIWARRKGRAPQGQPGRVSARMIRYLGVLPADASKLERLRWVRNFCLKVTLPSFPFVAIAVLVINKTWFSAAVAVLALIWLGGLIDLALDIRRERLRSGPA